MSAIYTPEELRAKTITELQELSLAGKIALIGFDMDDTLLPSTQPFLSLVSSKWRNWQAADVRSRISTVLHANTEIPGLAELDEEQLNYLIQNGYLPGLPVGAEHKKLKDGELDFWEPEADFETQQALRLKCEAWLKKHGYLDDNPDVHIARPLRDVEQTHIGASIPDFSELDLPLGERVNMLLPKMYDGVQPAEGVSVVMKQLQSMPNVAVVICTAEPSPLAKPASEFTQEENESFMERGLYDPERGVDLRPSYENFHAEKIRFLRAHAPSLVNLRQPELGRVIWVNASTGMADDHPGRASTPNGKKEAQALHLVDDNGVAYGKKMVEYARKHEHPVFTCVCLARDPKLNESACPHTRTPEQMLTANGLQASDLPNTHFADNLPQAAILLLDTVVAPLHQRLGISHNYQPILTALTGANKPPTSHNPLGQQQSRIQE